MFRGNVVYSKISINMFFEKKVRYRLEKELILQYRLLSSNVRTWEIQLSVCCTPILSPPSPRFCMHISTTFIYLAIAKTAGCARKDKKLLIFSKRPLYDNIKLCAQVVGIHVLTLLKQGETFKKLKMAVTDRISGINSALSRNMICLHAYYILSSQRFMQYY